MIDGLDFLPPRFKEPDMNDDFFKKTTGNYCGYAETRIDDDSFPRARRRCLFLAQWFGNADGWGYFESLARRFSQKGASVECLTSFFPRSFSERGDANVKKSLFWRSEKDGAIRIVRVPSYQNHSKNGLKRFFSYSSFGISAATIGRWIVSRPDVVFCYTFPTLRWAARFFRWFCGSKIVVFALDLWPDSVADSGMLRNRFLLRWLERWSAGFYRFADAVVVSSPGIKEKLIERGVAPEKIFFLYLWTNELEPEAVPSLATGKASSSERVESVDASRPFIVLFAGNIGTVQALDVVLDAAQLLEREKKNVVFRLVGDGVERDRLRSRVEELGIKNVTFVDRVPVERMAREYERADALLVHLKKTELFRVTIPSKTQAYLRAGKPILCGVAGDASDLVANARAGVSFEPENPVDLARAVCELQRRSPEELEQTGRNGFEYYNENLSLSVACRRIDAMLDYLFCQR